METTELTFTVALQATIREYLTSEVEQSKSHCLRCALEKAVEHLRLIQENIAALHDLTAHTHRVARRRPVEEAKPE